MLWVRPRSEKDDGSRPEQRLSIDMKKATVKPFLRTMVKPSSIYDLTIIELHSFSFLIGKAQPSNRDYSKQVSLAC